MLLYKKTAKENPIENIYPMCNQILIKWKAIGENVQRRNIRHNSLISQGKAQMWNFKLTEKSNKLRCFKALLKESLISSSIVNLLVLTSTKVKFILRKVRTNCSQAQHLNITIKLVRYQNKSLWKRHKSLKINTKIRLKTKNFPIIGLKTMINIKWFL